MKLLVSKNQYKASNCELNISDNMMDISAYSYDWWKFVVTDSVGNIVFNNYTYSNTTSGHQGNVNYKLRELGLKPHLTLSRVRHSLECIETAINTEIDKIKSEIAELNKLINKKGTHRSKNEERKNEIAELEFKIKDLIDFRDNYLDKKIYPIKKSKNDYSRSECYYDEKDREEITKQLDSYKKYFLKPNGKLQTNEYNDFINYKKDVYDYAPNSLEKLKLLLNLDQKSIQIALAYEHVTDIENMITDQDTIEFQKLQNFAIKHAINRHSLNLFKLDKLHTKQINDLNRKVYSKKEEVPFPVNDKLIQAESKAEKNELTVIKLPSQLRGEGRKQGHCIGSKHYIDQCYKGKQALNYKGYTYLLNNDLSVCETHGKYNCHTPEKVTQELYKLIG